MPSTSVILLDYVCPALGSIIATSMFAAPIRALQKATERGSLQELNPTPWIFMTGNCIGWVGYSYLTHDYFVLIANGPGILISLWLNFGAAKLRYLEEFSMYQQANQVNHPSSAVDEEDVNEPIVIPHTSPRAMHEKKVLLMIFCWLSIFSTLKFMDVSHEDQIEVVGIIVNINLVFFFGAPLSTIFIVLRTRNSSTIHLGTMVLNILNTTFWLLYGLSIMDPYICIPNGLGLLLGIAQGVLCMFFPRVQRKNQNNLENGLDDPFMKRNGLFSLVKNNDNECNNNLEIPNASTTPGVV